MTEPKKPVIGVTRCSKLPDYLSSVAQAGAEPRVLEFSDSPGDVLETIDGLLLTGGGDVDPAIYGAARHAAVHDAEEGRDRFEIDLARQAIARDVPILAICRGAQVLNVAAGGTLVQDIPSEIASDLSHSVERPADAIAHDIHVEPGSRLAHTLGHAIDGSGRCRVNSRHHQSVGRLGEALVVSARAADGMVEAIERPDATFCIGVQWHPENFWRAGRFSTLFDSFIAAAIDRMKAQP